MKRREFLMTSMIGTAAIAAGASANAAKTAAKPAVPAAEPPPPNGKILIAGGRFNAKWIAYMAKLTGKPRPKLLFLATANGDAPGGVLAWYQSCATVECEPSFQPSFINSVAQTKSWEDVLLGVDGIVCSGGNTLNQQAIWTAQGIDKILKKAWAQGIILGGASAGSLCWFEEGSTDSRPQELSIVKCLGFIKGSHAPHYNAEPGRRPSYQRLIASGEMMPGYACDNDAGILFEGAKPPKFLAAREGSKVFYVKAVDGKAVETEIPVEQF